MATAADNCNIALWDAHAGTYIDTFEYAGDIFSLEFLPDGQLASGNKSGEISFWNIATGIRVKFQAHSDRLNSLSTSQYKFASGSGDKTSRKRIYTFECDRPARSVALYPKNRVAACTKEKLYVWDIAAQKLEASRNINECKGVAVSTDGRWLAVSTDESVSLYDASTLDCIWSHDRDSWSVSFSPVNWCLQITKVAKWSYLMFKLEILSSLSNMEK